jgi:hypothetical protein
MMSGGREGGWVKKCFLSLRQTALLSAEGKKEDGSRAAGKSKKSIEKMHPIPEEENETKSTKTDEPSNLLLRRCEEHWTCTKNGSA